MSFIRRSLCFNVFSLGCFCRDWCSEAIKQLGVNDTDYNHIVCLQHLGSPALCDTCKDGACLGTCPADSGITTVGVVDVVDAHRALMHVSAPHDCEDVLCPWCWEAAGCAALLQPPGATKLSARQHCCRFISWC